MDKTNNFRRIKHDEIDSEKWNRCIDTALNCRVYAYDWHLDRTAIDWDALVWGDYEYVMPLPFRSKMGIKYLYQPLFSQQLGIFPTPPLQISRAFYNYILNHFKYSDLHTNSENIPPEDAFEIDFIPRKNYLLPLHKKYPLLSASFSKNTKRNIAKSKKEGLTLVKGIRLETYLKFKTENLQANIGEKDFASLKSLIAFGQRKGFGEIYGVFTRENQLCAAVYFCRWKNRVIYFNAASSKEGKELRGMYFLIDRFIQQNAARNIILDFEGSMIEGVERFYSGFGAKPESYFQLKFNRLPLLLKWFKRK